LEAFNSNPSQETTKCEETFGVTLVKSLPGQHLHVNLLIN